MAELYSEDFFGVDDMPRHLRNAAVLGGVVAIEMRPESALRLARIIENAEAAPRYDIKLHTADLPFLSPQSGWTALAFAAVLLDPIKRAALALVGLFHG